MNITTEAPKILSQRNFLKLWLAQILSEPALHILHFVLIIKLYELTHSNLVVSIFVALVMIPPILFSTLAGVVADIWNRKYILILANFSRALVAIALLIFRDQALVIIILAFVASTISQFFSPTQNSSIPALVKKEHLVSANTLFLFTIYASFLVGYSVAGPLLYWLGDSIYTVLIVMFLLATFSNLFLPSLSGHIRKHKGELKEQFRSTFSILKYRASEGIRFIKNNAIVLIAVIQVAVVFSVERAAIALLPDFAFNVLGFSISQISYFLITPVGLGALTGAFVINRIKGRYSKRKLILTGIAIDSLVLFLVPVYPVLVNFLSGHSLDVLFYFILIVFMAALAFSSGLADVMIIVSAQTMLQQRTGQEKRGRVFGNLTTLMNLSGLPLIIAVGFLATIFKVEWIVAMLGAVLLIMFFGCVLSDRYRLKHRQNRDYSQI